MASNSKPNKDGKPGALRSRTADGTPTWPQARIIDGYVYELESTHASKAEADKRVAAVRDAGDAAQAFSSGRPKLTPAGSVKGREVFFAHSAAVYRVPAGKLGAIEGDGVVWSDRPKREPPVRATKAAKGKPAGVKGKAGDDVKAALKRRVAKQDKAARAAASDADAEEDDTSAS